MGDLEHDELRDQSMPARKPSIDHDNHDHGDLDATRRGSDAQLAPYRDEATPMGGGKKTTGQDVELNVIGAKPENGGTRITLGGAAAAGIKVGAQGYVPIGDMAAFFTVDKVVGPDAFAFVKDEQVAIGTKVILNPTSQPQAVGPRAKHFETKIKGIEVVGGRTQITIAGGMNKGVRAGMNGYVILSGDRHEKFSVAKVQDVYCTALLGLRPDDIAGRDVVINP